MKKIENNFAVTGIVVKDAEIRQFANNAVARFSLAISRTEKVNGEDKRTSAFINAVEAWRKNENAQDAFSTIKKGTVLTIEGFIKPDEWTDEKGKHNRIVFVASKFYPAPEKQEENMEEEAK